MTTPGSCAMVLVANASRRPPTGSGRAVRRTGRSLPAGDWAGGEIPAALSWTDTKPSRELAFAELLVERLPLVLAAFEAGQIDHGKAWAFADVLGPAELTPTQLAA